MGSTCVTYLNLPIVDTRITNSRIVKGGDVLNNVIRSTQQSHPTISRLAEHIQSRNRKRGNLAQIDICGMIVELRAAQSKEDLDPLCLLDYAKQHWVSHTIFFDEGIPECKLTWKLWWHLLYGGVAAVRSPCPDIGGDPMLALIWAVEQGHQSLFRILISETSVRPGVRAEQLLRSLEHHKSIQGRWLGDLLAQYLQLAPSQDVTSSLRNTIESLLNLGADPSTPHHVSGSIPLVMLIHMIAWRSAFTERGREFIQALFSYPAIQRSVENLDVLEAIEQELSTYQPEAASEIFKFRPDLRGVVARQMARRNKVLEAQQRAKDSSRQVPKSVSQAKPWDQPASPWGREEEHHPADFPTSHLPQPYLNEGSIGVWRPTTLESSNVRVDRSITISRGPLTTSNLEKQVP